MHLLDDTLVITPKDLTRCDYGFLRRICELRGELPDSSVEEFQGPRTRRLTRELETWLAGDYRRRYSSTFAALDLPRASNLKELRQAHKETLAEVRSLRVVA
ncbi:MAG TPA: hypothetical protein VK054_09815, partial [Beutenbergiaceae bacterium]|nr:hypothetical protein [Beutenbergiaceae bacterium]